MLSVIGVILIIVGSASGAVFAGYEVGVLVSFAVTMFGAGLVTAEMWEKRKPETKKWVTILCLACVGLGSFIAGIARQISEDQVVMIITYVVAIALIIAGLIIPCIKNKKTLEKK